MCNCTLKKIELPFELSSLGEKNYATKNTFEFLMGHLILWYS